MVCHGRERGRQPQQAVFVAAGAGIRQPLGRDFPDRRQESSGAGNSV